MAFANKYNKGNPTFKVKLHEPAYTTLADLHNENGNDHVYPIAGLYINTKGKYGPQGMIAINDSLMVNLPSHLNTIATIHWLLRIVAIVHRASGVKVEEQRLRLIARRC